MNIQTTKNYKLFKFILGNRPLNRNNLRMITRSIAQENLLDVAPIIVNENMEIVDGQHRFQIAKENGFPINYLVLNGGELKHIHMLNNVSRKWGSEDYVRSYATQGNANYKRFLAFMQEHNMAASPAICLIKGFGGGRQNYLLKSGGFTMSQEEQDGAEERADIYTRIVTHFEGVVFRRERLIQAIVILDKAGFAEELIKRLDERDVKLTHQIDVANYLRAFEAVLNYNVKKAENFTRLF